MERSSPRRRCYFLSSKNLLVGHRKCFKNDHPRKLLGVLTQSRKKTHRKVAFSGMNTYYVIPPSTENSTVPLHYTPDDYLRFKNSAMEEIREIKSKNTYISTKQAVSILYQPTYAIEDVSQDTIEVSPQASSMMNRIPFLFPLQDSHHPLHRVLKVVSVTYQAHALQNATMSLTRSVMILIPSGAHHRCNNICQSVEVH